MFFYAYSFSATADGDCDGGLLKSEILAESLTSATLDRIDTSDDIIYVYFDSSLSSDHKIRLDAIIAAHSGRHGLVMVASSMQLNGSYNRIPLTMIGSVNVEQNILLYDRIDVDGRILLDGRLVEVS